jgi:hypothetical protein
MAWTEWQINVIVSTAKILGYLGLRHPFEADKQVANTQSHDWGQSRDWDQSPGDKTAALD